jgi:hypothetical protein
VGRLLSIDVTDGNKGGSCARLWADGCRLGSRRYSRLGNLRYKDGPWIRCKEVADKVFDKDGYGKGVPATSRFAHGLRCGFDRSKPLSRPLPKKHFGERRK